MAVFAFVINIMIPFFASYQQDISVQNPDEKILICHGDSFSYITMESLSKEAPQKNKYECPSCYVSAHGIKNILLDYQFPIFAQFYTDKSFPILTPPKFISSLKSHEYINAQAPPFYS